MKNGMIEKLMAQPQPAVQMVAPFNDVQLVAFVAAQLPDEGLWDASSRVRRAIEIVAEAVVQMQNDGLGKTLNRKKLEVQ